MMVISEKRCTIEINDTWFWLVRAFRFVIVVPVIGPYPQAVGEIWRY